MTTTAHRNAARVVAAWVERQPVSDVVAVGRAVTVLYRGGAIADVVDTPDLVAQALAALLGPGACTDAIRYTPDGATIDLVPVIG